MAYAACCLSLLSSKVKAGQMGFIAGWVPTCFINCSPVLILKLGTHVGRVVVGRVVGLSCASTVFLRIL